MAKLKPIKIQYAIRYNQLRLGGFKNYDQYLNSKIWEETRDYIYSNRRHECIICFSSGPFNLHHTQYLNIMSTDVEKRAKDVRILCIRCHEDLHKIAKDECVGLGAALKIMKKSYKLLYIQ